MEKISNRSIAFGLSLLSFVLYQFTLAPSVSFIDAGELSAVAYTLGIAHPTGYPLFTLLGFLVSHLGVSPVWLLNEFAALLAAAGIGVFFLVAIELLELWQRSLRAQTKTPKKSPKKGQKNSADHRPSTDLPTVSRLNKLAVVSAALLLMTSQTWWGISTSVEVYPLQLVFFPLTILFFIRMLWADPNRSVANARWFGLSLGLAFTNHMTTVLLAPAMLVLFFWEFGFTKRAGKLLGAAAVPFAAALLLYLYLPLRAATEPIMDWGHPATMPEFLRHVTGGQYKIWMFTGGGAAGKNWGHFWSILPGEFTEFGVLFALIGIYVLVRRPSKYRAKLLTFIALLFFGCLLYSINYSIHDIDPYFTLAFLAFAFFMTFGVSAILRVGYGKRDESSKIMYLAPFILIFVGISEHYRTADESNNYMVEDFTKNVLLNAPKNAVIFSTEYDFWLSAAFYYQLVEHIRPDVLVIDRAMLRDRPWYFKHLMQRDSSFMLRAKPEMDRFLALLRKFEAGEPYDQTAIGPAYSEFTSALISRNSDRPIFATSEIVVEQDKLFAPGVTFLPSGLLLQAGDSAKTFPTKTPKLTWRAGGKSAQNYYTINARLLQGLPLAMTSYRFSVARDTVSARQYLDLALRFVPDDVLNPDAFEPQDREFARYAYSRFSQFSAIRKALK